MKKALAGNWSQLRDLAKHGHPGVEMNRFIFSSIDEKQKRFLILLFGRRYGETTTEIIEHADVFSDGSHFGVRTELDVSSTETADWFKHHTYDVEDFTRIVSASREGTLQLPQDHWLAWSHEAREEFTSVDALCRGLACGKVFDARGKAPRSF